MKDKRVLYVSSEVIPYLPETEISSMSFEAPKMVNNNGGQIRIFMPRYGNINERRHQLHEVIRLSGMNLVINDLDMPLIIKVASIPKERMQVYFIDNDEYFKRKAIFSDEDDQLFSDNDERAMFFCRGVLETVIKNKTGIFFYKQDEECIISSVSEFEAKTFDYKEIRGNALRFSKERFEREIKDFVLSKYKNFKES